MTRRYAWHTRRPSWLTLADLAECEAQEDTRRVRRRLSVERSERKRGDANLHGQPLGQLDVAVGSGALDERGRNLGHHEVARVGAVDGEAGLPEHAAELLALLVEHSGVGRDEALGQEGGRVRGEEGG